MNKVFSNAREHLILKDRSVLLVLLNNDTKLRVVYGLLCNAKSDCIATGIYISNSAPVSALPFSRQLILCPSMQATLKNQTVNEILKELKRFTKLFQSA